MLFAMTGCTLETLCETGERRCMNEGNAGMLDVCADGFWGDKTECPNGYSCNVNGTFCGECTNDSVFCDKNAVKKCVEGVWETDQTCQSGCAEDKQHCADPTPAE